MKLFCGNKGRCAKKYSQGFTGNGACFHPGIVKIKVIARQYIYWPRIDQDLEAKVKECTKLPVE